MDDQITSAEPSYDGQTIQLLENRTFEEISVGDQARIARTITQDDIDLFAFISGDVNPAHLDPLYAAGDIFHHVVAHGLLGAGLISAVLGTELPGPGTIYLSQDLRFRAPVSIGDTLTATLTVTDKLPEHGDVVLDCRCERQDGKLAISGTARVRAPRQKVRLPRTEVPVVRLGRHQQVRALLARAAYGPPVPTALIHPCDAASLLAAAEAASARLIVPTLVGPPDRIASAAAEARIDITAYSIVAAESPAAAAVQAVRLAERGEVAMLMKGMVHTDEVLHAVLQGSLRTTRRLSHVYLLNVPGTARPLLLTDAAVNIAPDLEAKRDIVQNAIDLAHVLGITMPRVAILSAVETITPKLRSTTDAAALCKMADRGQITGALIDGPLAFDNAVSREAARAKRITSSVAGVADILVAPDLEAANLLAKQLTFLAGADAAGLVLGARIPIVLTSRADDERTQLASCAMGVLMARRPATQVADRHD